MTTFLKNKNYAQSALSGGVSIGALSLSVTAGQGALFPSSGNFMCVIWGQSYASPLQDTSREIIEVTAVSTDTFTIVRAQESTVAKGWSASDNIALVLTAGKINELESALNGNFNDSNSLHPVIGTPTYSTVKDYIDQDVSSGYFSGGILSAGAGAYAGQAAYTALAGIIKIADNLNAATVFFDLAGGYVPLTDNSINYIYVDYNGGSPQVLATTDRTIIKLTNQFNLGRAYRIGSSVDITNAGIELTNDNRNLYERLVARSLMEWMSGCQVGSSGLEITTTDGVFYIGYFRVNTSGKLAATNFEHYYYQNGSGGWTDHAATNVIDNTYYDDGSGTLHAISNNRYGVAWIFVDFHGDINIVYGQGNYTSATAISAQPPSVLPDYISKFTILCGKAIVKQGAAVLTELDSAFSTLFTPVSVVMHNDLSGLFGGADYYHLTTAKNTVLTTNSLTASLPVVTDGSGNIATITYAMFKGNLSIAQGDVSGLHTTDSPTFAGATIGSLAGYFFGTAGVVSAKKVAQVLTDLGFAAWTPYTPTLTPNSGSFNNVSSSGRYLTIGNMTLIEIINTLTDVGSAIGYQFTLPTTTQSVATLFGREINSGVLWLGTLNVSGNTLQAQTAAGSWTITNGMVQVFQGSYENT